MRHDAATLIEFLADLLVQAGFAKDEASAIARSLTLSERLGYASHGIAQISRYIAELRAGNIVSGATPRILQETPNSLVVDAQLGAGQVAMPIVLRNVLSKLATQATVTAAVRNCGHIGRLGEWVEHPAEAGYAALLFVNDNGLNRIVAPPGRQMRRHEHKPRRIQHSACEWTDLFRRYVDRSDCAWQGRKSQARWDGGSAGLHAGRRRRAHAQPGGAVRDPGRNNSSYGRPSGVQRVCAVHFRRSSGRRSVGWSGAASRAGHQGRELHDDGDLESGIVFRARSHESTSGQIY